MTLMKRDRDDLSIAEEQLEALTASSVANLMREQDAELLESHHAMGANHDTPEQSSCEAPVLIRDIPNIIMSPPDNDTPLMIGPGSTSIMIPRSPSDVIDSLGPMMSSLHGRRPTLSGQIFLTEPEEAKPLAADIEVDTDEVALRRRTESEERRISEAAQFAAVVGDASEIRIIDDHVDDETDDDESDIDNKTKVTEAMNQDARSVSSGMNVSIASVDRSFHSVGGGGGRPPLHSASSSSIRALSAKTDRIIVGRPLKPLLHTKRGFLDQLPANGKNGEDEQPSYIYKGIHSNPPEIVKSGMHRGNYAQLHRKAWLEVSDKYHRYGKNLRLYYRHWEKLGCPYQLFFDWLDSKGEAAGQPLPELEDCPRSELDADTVLYITDPEITEQYALHVVPNPDTGRGMIQDADGDPVATGSDGWIFVLRDNRLYGAQKITSVTGARSKERFHHSSFFGGKAVQAAGIFITDDDGYLTQLLPHSGHYRPGEAHMQRVLFFLYHMGVDLRTFEMDMQQILHVARDKDVAKSTGDVKVEKKKKIESLYLQPAVFVACFLAHKARFIGEGVFTKLHKIRGSSVTNVTEALELIDDGGCW